MPAGLRRGRGAVFPVLSYCQFFGGKTLNARENPKAYIRGGAHVPPRRRDAYHRWRVKINGHTATIGEKADPATDTILVDGKLLPESGDKVYIMLNKPRGYVTTMSDEKGRGM